MQRPQFLEAFLPRINELFGFLPSKQGRPRQIIILSLFGEGSFADLAPLPWMWAVIFGCCCRLENIASLVVHKYVREVYSGALSIYNMCVITDFILFVLHRILSLDWV